MSDLTLERGIWMLDHQITTVDVLLAFWATFGPWYSQPAHDRLC